MITFKLAFIVSKNHRKVKSKKITVTTRQKNSYNNQT